VVGLHILVSTWLESVENEWGHVGNETAHLKRRVQMSVTKSYWRWWGGGNYA